MARAEPRSPKRQGRKGIVTGDGKRRGRRGAATATRVPEIQVVRDAEEVFRAAILAGVLSAERSDRNWARGVRAGRWGGCSRVPTCRTSRTP